MKKLFSRFLHSVQTKITILLLSISIIPLIVASILIVNQTTTTTEEQVKETQTKTAQLNTNFIEQWFNEKITSIENLIETYPELKSDNIDDIIPILKVLGTADDDVKWYSYVDTDGYAYDTLGRDTNISAQDHFHFTKNTKEVFISDIIQDIKSNDDILIIDVPILDNNDNFIGIVQAILDPITIVNLINTIEIGDSGHGYLVAKNGTITAHSDEQLIGTAVSDSIKGVDSFEKMILSKDSGYVPFEKNMIAFEKIETAGWHLLISAPEKEVYASVNQSKLMTTIIIVISVVIVATVAYLFTKYIIRQLKDIMYVMENVSTGDLTERLTDAGKDQIAQLRKNINKMLITFSSMTKKIHTAIEQVAASSNQLKNTSDHSTIISNKITDSTTIIIDGAQSQLEASRQTSLSTEEMASGVHRIAETSVEISTLASDVTTSVNQGTKEVSHAVELINIASQSVESSVSSVRELQDKSEAVHQIIDLIANIADETNLLALNATIEAARAGEHGRGFSVVANEVKKLAYQTSEAITDIATILEEITTSTEQSASAMEGSLKEVHHGVSQVQKIDILFQSILQSFEEVNNEIQDISAISEEISAGTEEVAASAENNVKTNEHALDELNEISTYIGEQVSSMIEIADSSKSLNDMASDLQQLIREFKV